MLGLAGNEYGTFHSMDSALDGELQPDIAGETVMNVRGRLERQRSPICIAILCIWHSIRACVTW